MTGFAMIGALVILVCVAAGVYWLATNLTLKQNEPRFRYEKTFDEDGNEIDKVIDTKDE